MTRTSMHKENNRFIIQSLCTVGESKKKNICIQSFAEQKSHLSTIHQLESNSHCLNFQLNTDIFYKVLF